MAERNGSFAPKIAFPIGINISEIIIDGDDIFGDGVNVAASRTNASRAEFSAPTYRGFERPSDMLC